MFQIQLDMGEKLAIQERVKLVLCIFIKICMVHYFWDTLCIRV